jgi:hypothetical protein
MDLQLNTIQKLSEIQIFGILVWYPRIEEPREYFFPLVQRRKSLLHLLKIHGVPSKIKKPTEQAPEV